MGAVLLISLECFLLSMQEMLQILEGEDNHRPSLVVALEQTGLVDQRALVERKGPVEQKADLEVVGMLLLGRILHH